MQTEEAPSVGIFESFSKKWQYLLDKSSPLVLYRWIFFLCILSTYVLRVYYVNGWFIFTYGLGIYLLNQFIGFLSPQVNFLQPYQILSSIFAFWKGFSSKKKKIPL
jgi:hypothetical protein